MTVDRILALGASHGWPALRLAPGETLAAGEVAWRKHTAVLTPRQHARLVAALDAGWVTGRSAVGLVRGEVRP